MGAQDVLVLLAASKSVEFAKTMFIVSSELPRCSPPTLLGGPARVLTLVASQTQVDLRLFHELLGQFCLVRDPIDSKLGSYNGNNVHTSTLIRNIL